MSLNQVDVEELTLPGAIDEAKHPQSYKRFWKRAAKGEVKSTVDKKKSSVGLIFAHIVLILGSLVFLLPLVYAFFSALKPNDEIFSMPPTLIGSEIRWSNFLEVFKWGPFLTYIGNSFFISIVGTILVLITATMAGYAFGRLKWKGRGVVFLLFMATLMVPSEVVVVPLYTQMQTFGWVNSYKALIIPFVFSAFGTFLMRQFIRGIPYELEEAARVDGAGPIRTFAQIVVPLLKAPLAVLAVFTFIGFWNSYLWPLIVVVDYDTLGTLPIGLSSFSNQSGTRWDLQMAAAMISMVPTTALVIALRKHLVSGIAMSGMGGR